MAHTATNGSDDLIRLVDGWGSSRVMVVGDFMLDRYVYGQADRLSPDAPVPVLASRNEESKLGGAANVCLALRALRCHVACLGIVGRDDNAAVLRKMLRQAGCDTSGLLVAPDRPTTVKHNFVGLAQHRHPQKMFRVDDELCTPPPAQISRQLLARARKLLANADLLCMEDHDKGVLADEMCQKLIALARQRKIPVVVDPAAIEDYGRYRGATCMTPNRFEAALACGRRAAVDDEAAWPGLCRQLLRKLKLNTVVMTLDRHGMMLTRQRQQPQKISVQAKSVYDVTGAGDVVVATIAAAMANGADWKQAVQLANTAAGLEVQHFGVVPIDIDEIVLALLKQRHQELGKLRSLDQLRVELSAHRKEGKTVVFTNGCFDILHAGHISFLRQAAGQGDLLIVAVNSDASIGRIKGKGRPVNRQADRLMVLSELESIDYLIMFDQNTPISLIRAIKPDVLVKGRDYKRSEVVGGDCVERNGGKVVLVDLVKNKSTTNIIRRIASANGAGDHKT